MKLHFYFSIAKESNFLFARATILFEFDGKSNKQIKIILSSRASLT